MIKMSWEDIIKEERELTPGQKSFIDRATRTLHSQKQEEAETNEVMQQL